MFGTFSPGCADQALRVQRLPIWGAVVKAQVAWHSSEAGGGFPSQYNTFTETPLPSGTLTPHTQEHC